MMKYAFFPGCKIPFYLEQYESSSREVLKILNVELVDIEFNCCGYPVRDIHFDSFILSAAKNLALAEARGLDLLTVCKCCFGTLKKAAALLKNDNDLKKRINKTLAEDDLHYEGRNDVTHILSVLARNLDDEEIKARISKPYKGLKIAVQQGCHALRPSDITQFDDPLVPVIFNKLVALTGAEPVDWNRKLDCCGHSLWGKNDDLALAMLRRRVEEAKEFGADAFCTACTYCQMQYDAMQAKDLLDQGKEGGLPSILFTQLFGLSMGIPKEKLGFEENEISLEVIADRSK